MAKREITKKELLLAIAMGTYYQNSHVLYIPAGTSYIKMLNKMKRLKIIEPIKKAKVDFYRLTKTGWDYLRRQDIVSFADVDKEIDKFVDNL